jgi:hypothetical protein
MNRIIPIEPLMLQPLMEQRLIEAIRRLSADKQQSVLDFAEFLQNRQNPGAEDNRAESQLFVGAEAVCGLINLAERGIDIDRAAELRSRLQTFAQDWNRPEMAIYDEL